MKKLILGAILLLVAFGNMKGQTYNKSLLTKMQLAEIAINNLYVDKVNEDKLIEGAITGMLSQLDPHSTYSNAEDVKLFNASLQGNFYGIGVQFQMMEDSLFVIQTVAKGPSERVGILAGDRIIAVNDTAIAGVKMTNENIMSRLRGPKNTLVKLTVLRRGVKELLYYTVKRDKISTSSIDAAYIIQPGTAYVRIKEFSATTGEEFKKALEKMRKLGMKNLILDLQENGGGYLNAAIDVANEFLNEKELIVYTQGKKRDDFYAIGDGKFKKGKLIVLVNEFTASASEIVSGAVQDNDRGLIVGRRTFGKGLVQRPIDFPDGSMMRLTIARYYTPAGRCIQKPYSNKMDYATDILKRYEHGEMQNSDSIHFPDSLKYKTLKMKRVVYGGGGIMPDYFVPVDTTYFTKYLVNLNNKGIIQQVSTRYIEENKVNVQGKYKDFDAFDAKFSIDKTSILSELRSEADKSGIKFDKKQYEISLPYIKMQLKALIARNLWTMDEYFEIANRMNNSINCALDIINDKTPHAKQIGFK